MIDERLGKTIKRAINYSVIVQPRKNTGMTKVAGLKQDALA